MMLDDDVPDPDGLGRPFCHWVHTNLEFVDGVATGGNELTFYV